MRRLDNRFRIRQDRRGDLRALGPRARARAAGRRHSRREARHRVADLPRRAGPARPSPRGHASDDRGGATCGRSRLAAEAGSWHVAKLYLPAWSGGGGTYDDACRHPMRASSTTRAASMPLRPHLRADRRMLARRACEPGDGKLDRAGAALYPLHRLDRGVERTLDLRWPAARLARSRRGRTAGRRSAFARRQRRSRRPAEGTNSAVTADGARQADRPLEAALPT